VVFPIFIPGHWSTIVKILDVEGTKPCVERGNAAVENKFGGEEAGCFCGGRTRKIEAISTGTVADAMGFGLGGAKRCFLLAVSDLAPGRYIVFVDERKLCWYPQSTDREAVVGQHLEQVGRGP
jgi:hypothetical protein